MSKADRVLLLARKPRQRSTDAAGRKRQTTAPTRPDQPGAIVTAPQLCLRLTDHRGLGVFTLRNFARGEIIERAPVILLPDPQWKLINRTALRHYYYTWPADMAALVFGFGSFYNHSATPNAEFIRHSDELIMEYVALREIAAGEEIFIKYGCPLWFEAI